MEHTDPYDDEFQDRDEYGAWVQAKARAALSRARGDS